MYATGNGLAQDDAQAVQWFRKAAEQGNGPAQFNIGLLTAKGQGTPRDLVDAEKWLILASQRSSGDELGTITKTRDIVAGALSPEQPAEAQMRASAWMRAFGQK